MRVLLERMSLEFVFNMYDFLFQFSHFVCIFQVGDNWLDKKYLTKAIVEYAAIQGFVTCVCGSTGRVCNRWKKSSTKRKYTAGDLKCGCGFKICFRPSLYVPRNEARGIKSRANFDDGYFVTISLSVMEHSGGCEPSPRQLVMQKSRSGRYVSDISLHCLFTICNACVNGRIVDNSVSVICCYYISHSFCNSSHLLPFL